MSALSKPYKSIDAAALGGFKKIQMNSGEWHIYEYGFMVIELRHQVVRQLGHEGFMDTEMQYHYTEPRTDRSTSSITQTVPAAFAMSIRAFCHTHPTPGTFSTTDFNNFKKLRDLKTQNKLRYNVIYYLMESDGKVRRSDSEDHFREGVEIEGLDSATP